MEPLSVDIEPGDIIGDALRIERALVEEAIRPQRLRAAMGADADRRRRSAFQLHAGARHRDIAGAERAPEHVGLNSQHRS